MSARDSEGNWRGSLWNPFLDRLLEQEPPLGVEAMRLALALARLVFGFNETERGLGTDLVRRTARLHGRSLERARDQLIARRLLEVDSGSPGRGKRTVWRLLRYLPDELASAESPARSSAEKHAEMPARDPAPERGRILEAEEEIPTSWHVSQELTSLGLTTRQLGEVARHSPELVRQWLAVAAGKDVRSRAAVLIAGLRSGKPPSPPSKCSLARAYVAQHGWPTGTSWVRGSHSGAYVRDPLGHDKPPYAVPWPSPSLAEIEGALEDDGGGAER